MRRAPSLGVAITVFPRVLSRGQWRVDTSVVALVQRGRPPGVGLWSLPGGRVEWGEPLAAAALRELGEELGMRERVTLVEPASGVASFATTDALHAEGDGAQFHYGVAHVLVFVDAAGGALPVLTAGDDAAACRWFATCEPREGSSAAPDDIDGGSSSAEGLLQRGGLPGLDSAPLIGPVAGVLAAARRMLLASPYRHD